MNDSLNSLKDSKNVRDSGQLSWDSIDWDKAGKSVRKLQARIVKAQQEGRHGKVRSLSRILTRSFAAKVLAVKRVTQNKGKHTPGVDGVLWNTPKQKARVVEDLNPQRYKAKPLRRVYIPKSNGKERPLGIPTMKDRAMQALYLMALEPIAETTADWTSFGFRKGRSVADAIEQCYCALARKSSSCWVLEGDIKGCFDNISHEWLDQHIPMEKRILNQWLKAGYIEKTILFSTGSGTPQGGIISPVLANMTLDGLECLINERYKYRRVKNGRTYWQSKHNKVTKVNLIRYADDFVITGASRELLENEVKPMVCNFLSQRGLTLSESKTRITNIEDGFDFLGFNIRKYDTKLLIKPSKKSVKGLLCRIRRLVKSGWGSGSNAEKLIRCINPILRGWANYYRHAVSKQAFRYIDHNIWKCFWQWAMRRHSQKGKRWIKRKYFIRRGNRNWVFSDTSTEKECYLFSMSMMRIERHVKIRQDANPFDSKWQNYFETRRMNQRIRRLRNASFVKVPGVIRMMP